MRSLSIPESYDDHVNELCTAIGPLGNVPYWRRLAGHLAATIAPLFYESTDDAEVQNLSNWFGLINRRTRFYATNPDGPLLRSLYVAHELAHLVPACPWTGTRPELMAAFAASERFASYETELRVYDDVPELVDAVPFRPLLAAWLAGRGVDLADTTVLMAWRDAVCSQPALLTELPAEAERLASYNDNDSFSAGWWERLDRLGIWEAGWRNPHPGWPPGTYRTDCTDSPTPPATGVWENAVVATVTRAHVLAGLPAPALSTITDARAAALRLDGQPLATDTTPTPTTTTTTTCTDDL